MRFPLEPLCTVRGIRLHKLEAALRHCREQYERAEHQRLEAAARCEQATQERQAFAETSWRQLLEGGQLLGEALNKHERHLALLDQQIQQRHAELETSERERAQAKAAMEEAATAWQQARNKLDALGEMKQGWLREARNQQALREEHSVEELMLSHTKSH
ncbi:hypothetical protein [Dyella subtropica]|uniref:hypothetical protein n=1 Tax=Dyella subtropica TaxID=2992127 RepID=UPI00224EAB58|nr:hypothetical protein [Dyella subtropica]